MADYRNMFGPPIVDFSTLGQLGNTYMGARKVAEDREREQMMQRELKSLADMGKLDANAIGLAALKTGNVNAAMAAAQLASSQQDRQFNQGIQTQQLGLSKRNVELAEKSRGPNTVNVKDASGNDVTMMWDATQNKLVPIQGSGSGTPTNPYATGKFTNEEGKAAGFSDRMFEAENNLSKVAVQGADPKGRAFEMAPLGVGNYAQTPEYQSFAQARDNFINAQLRRESGAAISPSEYKNADKQYFPVPGDEKNPNILKQKAKNRQDAIEAMARESGRHYSPKYEFHAGGIGLRQQPSSPGAASSGQKFQEGQTATNKATGQRMIYRNGQWAPL
jgi:hypothetical protein